MNSKNRLFLKALIRSRRRIPHIAVHFRWWRAEDQGANGTATDLNILKTAQNVDFLVGQDNAAFCHVLDCVLKKKFTQGNEAGNSSDNDFEN